MQKKNIIKNDLLDKQLKLYNKLQKYTKPTWIPSIKTNINKNVLEKFGYTNIRGLTRIQRHNALINAHKELSASTIIKKLISLLNQHKDENEISKLFKEDAVWIKNRYIESPIKNKIEK